MQFKELEAEIARDAWVDRDELKRELYL